MSRVLVTMLATIALLAVLARPGLATNADGIAVIVGNRTYGEGVPAVRYAHNDAEAMRRFVIDVLGFREGNVFVLEDATLGRMQAMFGSAHTYKGELFYAVRPEESDVFVFYSGHGVPGPPGPAGQRQGVLLPVDASPRAPMAAGYPLDILLENLSKLPARSVTVFLDTCFSGVSNAGLLVPGTSAFGVEAVAPPKRTSMTVLSAASGAQYAVWDEEAEHGLFTEYLLRGLYGAADDDAYGRRDRRVTAGELSAYLRREMSYRARREFRTEQTPQLSGEGGQVLSSWTASRPLRGRGWMAPPITTSEQSEQDSPPESAASAIRDDTLRPPADMSNPPKGAVPVVPELDLFPSRIHRMQRALTTLGYYKKSVDGIFGPNTQAALQAWQRDTGRPIGPLTARALNSLLAAAVQPDTEVAREAALSRPPAANETSRQPVQSMRPGSVFRDCADCPEMVIVPAGSFLMGSPRSESGRKSNEGPQHLVTLARPFAVGVYEVTFDEWDACVTAGGCAGYRPSDEGWGRDRRPVIWVSWQDAQRYAEWLSSVTGQHYRLLTEAEWEYAARASTETAYWWGTSIGDGNVTYWSDDTKKYVGPRHPPVGSGRPNPFGLYDVHGSVWEWVEDCRSRHCRSGSSYEEGGSVAAWVSLCEGDDYRDASPDGSALTLPVCSHRVMRGGAWVNSPGKMRAAYRAAGKSSSRSRAVGFRVARTL